MDTAAAELGIIVLGRLGNRTLTDQCSRNLDANHTNLAQNASSNILNLLPPSILIWIYRSSVLVFRISAVQRRVTATH